jgi:hypothetical protein
MGKETGQLDWLKEAWAAVPALREDEFAEVKGKIDQTTYDLTALEQRLFRFTDAASITRGYELIHQMKEKLAELEAKRDELQGLVGSK